MEIIKQLTACLAIMFLASHAHGQTSDSDSGLKITRQNTMAWKKHIRPSEQELEWKKIAWLPDLKSGLTEASRSGKPILLWTMNGHPFGCT